MNENTDLELESTMIEVLTELCKDAEKLCPDPVGVASDPVGVTPATIAPINPLRPQQRRIAKIPVKMIDYHTSVCIECENRRLHMKQVYELRIDPDKHTNEYLARDIIFEGVLEECRECYIKSLEQIE
jgi:hypothetical protein